MGLQDTAGENITPPLVRRGALGKRGSSSLANDQGRSGSEQ